MANQPPLSLSPVSTTTPARAHAHFLARLLKAVSPKLSFPRAVAGKEDEEEEKDYYYPPAVVTSRAH